ncbi:MAG: acyl-CoA/acyl-ACP dehydrogenase [bacterium]|nr:acyl-CoA/acyl-ACP dehydrogenase [bacterium]
MDLELSEEQQMIKDMTRALLGEHCPIEVVREMEDDPKGYPAGLWKQMAEAGLVGVLIPESHGGGGLGLLEAALVYEELGRAMAPTPHFVSAVLSAGMLLEAGSEAQQEAWLPKIVAGDAILTPAWLEPDRGFGPEGVALAAKREGDEYLLSGVKRHVNYASSAERLIVLARSDDGVELLLVDPSGDGVELKQIRSQSGEAHYRVELRDVRVPVSARIGAAGSGWETFAKVLQDGLVLQAAQAIGGADRCLENTVEYAKVRKQFDKPLGAFQALAHYMADASTQIEGGRVLVHEAAWNGALGRSTARFAPMAKLFACNTYQDVTRVCAQIWGGVAFTIEYDTQMYFRRAKEMQLSWWDTPYLEELVAADVLDQ